MVTYLSSKRKGLKNKIRISLTLKMKLPRHKKSHKIKKARRMFGDLWSSATTRTAVCGEICLIST